MPNVISAQNCGELSFGDVQVESNGDYSIDVFYSNVSPFFDMELVVTFLDNNVALDIGTSNASTPSGVSIANITNVNPRVKFTGASDGLPDDRLGTIYFQLAFPDCITGVEFGTIGFFFTSGGGCGTADVPATDYGAWCPPERQLSGLIETAAFGDAMPSVDVIATNAPTGDLFGNTSNSGYYYIDCPSSDLTVSASKEDGNDMCGISVLDLVLVGQHILANTPFTEAWQFIAADVNQDDQVTTLDMIKLRSAILNGSADGFSAPKNWDLIPTDVFFDFPSTVSDVPTAYSTTYSIEASEADVQGLGFVGVKTGDVNANYCTNIDGLGPIGNIGVLQLSITDKIFAVQEEAYIPVYASDFNGQYIFSLSMELDPLLFEIFDVIPGQLADLDESAYKIDASQPEKVDFLWFAHDLSGKSIAADEPLFYLGLRAPSGASGLDGNIDIDDKSFSKDNSKSGGLRGFDLAFVKEESVSKKPIDISVSPNPFTSDYQIKMNLPRAQTIQLRLVDIHGKVVADQQYSLSAGHQLIKRDQLSDLATGTYYQQLITEDGVVVVPLVKI